LLSLYPPNSNPKHCCFQAEAALLQRGGVIAEIIPRNLTGQTNDELNL
jgi:hypothetical protein